MVAWVAMKLRRAPALAAAVLIALTAYPVAGLAEASQRGTHPPYGRAQMQRDVAAIRGTGVVGVLAEADDGRIKARSGRARPGSRRPISYGSYFRIGSATKAFVATVVLQLAAERRLSLADTVARWLPGVVSGHGNNGRKITIRELLQNTSGIYDYTGALPLLSSRRGYLRNRFRSTTPRQLIAIAMRHRPLFRPGTRWSYSNTNYILLGMIIGKVTGRNWAQQVHDRIIVPLGLRRTFMPGARPHLPRPHPDGYQQFTPGGPLTNTTAVDATWAGSAGGMVSTLGDLDKFFRALVAGRLLPPAELAQMEHTVPAPGLAPPLTGTRYGLGLIWIPLSCGGGYWGHAGDILGYSVWDGVTRDGDRSAVVMASTERAGQPALGQHVAEARLVDHALCAGR
jgi:D-alanyl-D-alanine carboxypeptidase